MSVEGASTAQLLVCHLFRNVHGRAIEAAGFGSLQQASVAYREADVIKDFRIFFAAESQFTQMDAGHYAAPEKLAHAANYEAVQWQPAGRRSLAIYPDGVVFATSARRVPTRDDVPLGDR